jgi:hypothetical protein
LFFFFFFFFHYSLCSLFQSFRVLLSVCVYFILVNIIIFFSFFFLSPFQSRVLWTNDGDFIVLNNLGWRGSLFAPYAGIKVKFKTNKLSDNKLTNQTNSQTNSQTNKQTNKQKTNKQTQNTRTQIYPK